MLALLLGLLLRCVLTWLVLRRLRLLFVRSVLYPRGVVLHDVRVGGEPRHHAGFADQLVQRGADRRVCEVRERLRRDRARFVVAAAVELKTRAQQAGVVADDRMTAADLGVEPVGVSKILGLDGLGRRSEQRGRIVEHRLALLAQDAIRRRHREGARNVFAVGVWLDRPRRQGQLDVSSVGPAGILHPGRGNG